MRQVGLAVYSRAFSAAKRRGPKQNSQVLGNLQRRRPHNAPGVCLHASTAILAAAAGRQGAGHVCRAWLEDFLAPGDGRAQRACRGKRHGADPLPRAHARGCAAADSLAADYELRRAEIPQVHELRPHSLRCSLLWRWDAAQGKGPVAEVVAKLRFRAARNPAEHPNSRPATATRGRNAVLLNVLAERHRGRSRRGSGS